MTTPGGGERPPERTVPFSNNELKTREKQGLWLFVKRRIIFLEISGCILQAGYHFTCPVKAPELSQEVLGGQVSAAPQSMQGNLVPGSLWARTHCQALRS